AGDDHRRSDVVESDETIGERREVGGDRVHARRAGQATRASQRGGSSSSSAVGNHSGPRHAASIARGPPCASIAATNASPTSYWRNLASSPISLWKNPVVPPVRRRASS